MKVRVYWNLHKKCFSIQDYFTRRVIGHADRVALMDPIFKVSEAGRQRVLRERKKNVHAFVVGNMFKSNVDSMLDTSVMDKAYYNPYQTETFVDPEGNKLENASVAVCEGGKVYYEH